MASSDVSAVTTNFFPRAHEGFITTVGGSGVSSGGATVPLTSVAGLNNGDIFIGVVDPGSNAEQTFVGVVDVPGLQITGVNWTRGSNTAHAAGKTVVDYVSGTYINLIQKGLLVSHDQDGTLKAGSVDNTAVLADNIITTAKISDTQITPNKLNLGAATATVNIAESTSSTSLTDLTTTTDQVTLTVGAHGLALVLIEATAFNSNVGEYSQVSVNVTGASTVTNQLAILDKASSVGEKQLSGFKLYTGLNPGSTTFKMKYKVTGGTGTFGARGIVVIPL